MKGLIPLQFLFLAVGALSLNVPESIRDKIDPDLLNSSVRRYTDNIIVTFVQNTDEVLQSVANTRYQSRNDRLLALKRELTFLAEASQDDVIKYLTRKGYYHRSIWISNQLLVANATDTVIIALASRNDVKYVAQEVISDVTGFVDDDGINAVTDGIPWGLKKIQAPEAIKYLKQLTRGNFSNIIVGSVDTGVRYTHEELRDNWVGVGGNGWFDPYGRTLYPKDDHGHGTHTLGTMVGKTVGVFPYAKWLACKGCSSGCFESTLKACLQYMLCPHDKDGNYKDCSKAPHLVSNSWGSDRYHTIYEGSIRALRVGNIIPLFSAGNAGTKCETIGSPGSSAKVISVGSTTLEDRLSHFSSVGPTVDGRIRPDVVAPGTGIYSAYHLSDTAYETMQGTSMACPHTAGTVAILLAYDRSLSFDDILNVLKRGAETKSLKTTGKVCGGIPDNVFPNNHFGHGRINALNSLKLLANGN